MRDESKRKERGKREGRGRSERGRSERGEERQKHTFNPPPLPPTPPPFPTSLTYLAIGPEELEMLPSL